MTGEPLQIKQCRVPLCTNFQEISQQWPMCRECMMSTIKRFKRFLPYKSDGELAEYICENIDSLIKSEEDVIRKRGVNYDRDELDE